MTRALWIAICVSVGAGCATAESDSRLPWVPQSQRAVVADGDALFHLALASDLIVEAHGFSVGWSEFHDRDRRGGSPTLEDGSHRSMTGVVDRVIFGERNDPTIRFDVYCARADRDSDVACSALRELATNADRRVALFLQKANGAILYFAGHTPDALQPPLSDEVVAAVHSTWRGTRARLDRAPRPPIQARVDAELARITRSAREQYDAMRALIALGPSAVPAIVRHMGDRRRFPRSWIMAENAPDFWEAYAHYRVGRVVDALAFIADRLTNGPSCWALLDGEAERRRCEMRWIAFVARGLEEGAFGEAWR